MRLEPSPLACCVYVFCVLPRSDPRAGGKEASASSGGYKRQFPHVEPLESTHFRVIVSQGDQDLLSMAMVGNMSHNRSFSTPYLTSVVDVLDCLQDAICCVGWLRDAISANDGGYDGELGVV